MPVLASNRGWRPPTSSDGQGPRRLAAWLAAQCVANSQPTLPRAHVATRYAAQRLRALALSSWAARGCLVNRHPGRASHNTVHARNAACLASPSAPPAPPPSKAVRPLSRMRRARRRLRRPCPGLPSHWALGSASKDRRTGVGEGRARSRWGRRFFFPTLFCDQYERGPSAAASYGPTAR